jgi:hypothetical protein
MLISFDHSRETCCNHLQNEPDRQRIDSSVSLAENDPAPFRPNVPPDRNPDRAH